MAAKKVKPADNPLLEFRNRYYYRPDLLVIEQLGETPDEKQTEIMLAVAHGERRISVRSGHRVGKTTLLAWLIIWWILTRFPQKCACTAPTESQLFDGLAAETKKWITKLTPEIQELLEVQSDHIYLKAAKNESFVSFATSRPEKPEAIAGKHADHVLLICDEASGIHDAVYESAEGSMAGAGTRMILAGNPLRRTGLFAETFGRLKGLWKTFHISSLNHPRVSQDFVEGIRRRHGENSNVYRVRVLGELPLADDDSVIPFELAQSALRRDVAETMTVKPIWGVDVARYGDDASALAKRRGNTLMTPVVEKRGWNTMQVAGWVKAEYDNTPPSERPSEILVDVIGLGAGVVDRLQELDLPVRGINVSEAPSLFDERYLNQRTELYFSGKKWLEAKDCSLNGDEGLADELSQATFRFTSSGKYQVESKEDMKKRGIASPNKADAFLLTLAGDAVSALSGGETKTRSSWKKALKRGLKRLS